MANSTVNYRDVEGFPGYRVGDDGSVWTCWRTCRSGSAMTANWKQIKACPHKGRTPGRTYLRVNLSRGGQYRTFRVHRLVLEAFVGPCPEGMECRHLSGDPSDNRLCNLAWGTPEENRGDCRTHDRYGRGESHTMAELTEAEVRQIRNLYAADGVLMRELADRFGTSEANISFIVNRRSWKHVV